MNRSSDTRNYRLLARRTLWVALAALARPAPLRAEDTQAELTVRVDKLRSGRGQVACALYPEPRGLSK